MLVDSHTHSRFSMDSVADCEKNILTAIGRGLDALAFTDHVDPVDSAMNYRFDFDEYFHQLIPLREKYADSIVVLLGVEMGLNLEKKEWIEQALSDPRFDFAIGSLHTLGRKDISSYLRTSSADPSSFFLHYYEVLLDHVEHMQGFHILGHMDYPDRYIKDKSKIPPFSTYRDAVAAILEKLIQKDLVLEYNTAGKYKGLDYGNPKPSILALYRDLGGENICLSSDAHKPEHIGRDFASAREYLSSLGFTRSTYFRNKQPIRVPLF